MGVIYPVASYDDQWESFEEAMRALSRHLADISAHLDVSRARNATGINAHALIHFGMHLIYAHTYTRLVYSKIVYMLTTALQRITLPDESRRSRDAGGRRRYLLRGKVSY